MTYFKFARLKLTLWYLAIIAIVSFSFSAIIYRVVIAEVERSFQMAELHLLGPNTIVPRRVALKILNEDFEIAKRAVMMRLIYTNGIIILASGVASYLLAGKALAPMEEALEEQKRFTADASHELKTPLTSLRTELEVALRDKNMKLKEAKNLLQSNLEEVINMQRLSENLMKLTKYSQSNNSFNTVELNIKKVVEEATKRLRPLANEKSININKDISSVNVHGDYQSLVELFTILIDNAIKYSPPNTKITIESSLHRNKVAIKVTDEGEGISKENIMHIFDRFYRADISRNKAQADGFGLGLAIAKQIIDRHHGEISVQSKMGKGSVFSVTLPLS